MPQVNHLMAYKINERLHEAVQICGQSGQRLTPLRRRVLQLLLENESGLKAYSILQKLKLSSASVTATTVYRVLSFLIEQGLVHKIERTNHFIACNQLHHDPFSLFLVCPLCGRIIELHDRNILDAFMLGLSRSGFTLCRRTIEVDAVCDECNRKGISREATSIV